MRDNKRNILFLFSAFLLCFSMMPLSAAAQEKTEKAGHRSGEFCSNWNHSSKDRVGFNELREYRLPATGRIDVDGGKNGGVAVKGADVSEVLVRACVNTWATTEELAQAIARNITINTSGTIRAENSVEDQNWGVSFQVTVPRNYGLKLSARNGGIAISGVEGMMEFETVNGGISLNDVAGDVRGRTTNGGLSVKLSGSGWRGAGLDVTTTNGGVNLSLPEGYAANIETGTVNGGYKTDFPALHVERTERWRAVNVNAPLNGGGAPVKVMTTNGGVVIRHYGETKF